MDALSAISNMRSAGTNVDAASEPVTAIIVIAIAATPLAKTPPATHSDTTIAAAATALQPVATRATIAIRLEWICLARNNNGQ
jgi:hypothetical protein